MGWVGAPTSGFVQPDGHPTSHREKHNHGIKLEEEKEKFDHEYVSLYRMLNDELLLTKQYLEKHLNKNFIKSSLVSYRMAVGLGFGQKFLFNLGWP
jgi:hypothetical protein